MIHLFVICFVAGLILYALAELGSMAGTAHRALKSPKPKPPEPTDPLTKAILGRKP